MRASESARSNRTASALSVCRLSTYSQVRMSRAETASTPASSPPTTLSGSHGESSSCSPRQIDQRPGSPWVACSSSWGRMP